MENEFQTIETQELDGVTGGWAWLTRALPFLGGLFGGGGGNTNVNVGNNQRTAQGNQGPVSQGDGSPITVNQQ
jgi:hypothetical protein